MKLSTLKSLVVSLATKLKVIKPKKSLCCGLGAKFFSKDKDSCSKTSKCCPCKYIVKTVLFVLLMWALSFTGFYDKAVKRFIEKNPRIIIGSIENMIRKEKENKMKDAEKSSGDVAKAIEADRSNPYIVVGSGKNLIIEFFDYNCGYCRKAHKEIESLISSSVNAKIILVNTPIMSEGSMVAAKYGNAIFKIKPQKFFEFHNAMMNHQGQVDATVVKKTLSSFMSQKEVSEIESIVKSRESDDEIKKVYGYIQSMSLQGTPAFIVNEKLIPGYMSAEEIMNIVK